MTQIADTLGSISRYLCKDARGEYYFKPLMASLTVLPDLVVVERCEAE